MLARRLRDVGRAPLDSIAAEARRLVNRAKNRGLTIKDVQGSNVGMHRVKYPTPIINPGQAAILGVGSVQPAFRPGEGGEPVPGQEIGLVPACDHRTWDGVAAAAFLNRVADNLAQPLELIRPVIGSECDGFFFDRRPDDDRQHGAPDRREVRSGVLAESGS